MKRVLSIIVAFLFLSLLGLMTYRVYVKDESSIPSYETAIDPERQTDNDSPDTPIITQSTAMPSEEKIINLFPEYIHAHRVVVGYGASIAVPSIPDLTVQLIDIVQDGRCPDGALCNTAGWATVIVEITYKDRAIREELYVQGGAPVFYGMPLEKDARPGRGNIIRTHQYMLFAAALSPRPAVGGKQIDKNDYALTVFVDTKENVTERKHLAVLARAELQQHVTDHQKYYVRDIVDRYELHGQKKKVIFHDPMEQERAKYAVDFSWKDDWIVTGFETQ